jgi:hypothetical protein
MHYLIFPKQDAWIYSKYPSYNYGLDEILEIRKDVSGSIVSGSIINEKSRILIQFNTASFSAKAIASASYFYLNLYAANPLNLATDYTIEVYPITQSWTNGTGFPAGSRIKYDGASWTNKSTGIAWASGSGGYYTTSSVSASQTFSYNLADIRMDVTNIVRSWTSGTLPNYGFMIKLSNAEELDTSSYGRLTFYSMDTHTVNLPVLEAVWDDSIFITGSSQMVYSGSVYGQLLPGSTVSGQFESASGQVTTGTGTITAEFLGTAQHFVTQSLSSSLSQSFNTILGGVFSGSLFGVLSGSISGTMSASIVSSTLFIGTIGGGSLIGSYNSSSLITGSISGSIISTGSAYMFVSGNIDIYVSGTFSGSFIGTSSNANQYYFEFVNISGSGNQSGSITGSYSGQGTINFTNSKISSSMTVSGSQYFNPPAIISGSFINTLAGVTFQALSSDQLAIVMRNLKKEYKYTTQTRIRLVGKDQYQRKTFLNTAATQFSVIKYLPRNNTWYSIVDAYTNRIIIPFSDYTKVSCDTEGNFFDLNLNGFMPERFYKIIFKVTFNDVDSYFDNQYIFKVVK